MRFALPAVRKPTTFEVLAISVIILPQIALKPIGGAISTVDLLAPIILFFTFFRSAIRLPRAQLFLFCFLVFSCFSFLAHFGIKGGVGYTENASRLLRLVSIWCPAFLIPYLNPSLFPSYARLFSGVSILVTLVVGLSYQTGSSLFDAHQTLLESTGDRYNRLGGLVGETGGFAFNSFISYSMAMVFLVILNKSPTRWAWLVISNASFFLAYDGSLARVMVMNFLVFWLAMYMSRITPPFIKITFPLLAIFGIVAILPLALSSGFRIFSRFSNLGTASFNQISSGRGHHWENAIELWTSNIDTFVFGIGNRMSGYFLGHVVENFFLYHFLEFGLLGALLFFAYMWVILSPILSFSLKGNLAAQGLACIWASVMTQWMFNDLNTYYQTFPAFILLTIWCNSWVNSSYRKTM